MEDHVRGYALLPGRPGAPGAEPLEHASSLGRQLGMMLMLMLTSKGVAGVSRAAFIILLATADQFGLPHGPILLLLGIDQLMDMGRTTINVVGNCLASAVVARWEGEFAKEKPAEEPAPAIAQ